MPLVDEYICPICGSVAYGVYCYDCGSFRDSDLYEGY